MKKNTNFTRNIMICMIFFFCFMLLLQNNSTRQRALIGVNEIEKSISHSPIYINGNAALAAFCGSGNGSGTSIDPYIIKGFDITTAGPTGVGVQINNTSLYLTIRNCTVQGIIGANQAGINVNRSSHVTITNCSTHGNYDGIIISWSNNTVVKNCNASSNNFLGIGITNSTLCNATSNIVNKNTIYGLAVAGSSAIVVDVNTVSECGFGGIVVVFSSTGNNITRNDVHSISQLSGIGLYFSSSNLIQGNNITKCLSNNEAGIFLNDADNNVISSNYIHDCCIGMHLSAPAARSSTGNKIFENNVTHSGVYGIYIDRAQSNLFFLNNFIGNFIQAALNNISMSANNDWNGSSLGNYWSDYTSKFPHATNDGIRWIEPYGVIYTIFPIPKRTYDWFPLVQPAIPNARAPALTLGSVLPSSGTQLTPFNFQVTYTDSENDFPVAMNLVVNGSKYPMQKVYPNDKNYKDGCLYSLQLYLQPGLWTYFFNASDSRFSNWTSSKTLNVGSTNINPPVLSQGKVSPSHGFSKSTTFQFSVVYSDQDNNAPVSINVTVKSSNTTKEIFHMSKQDPLDTNYIDGCIYVVSMTFSSSNNYTYYFNATDGVWFANTGNFTNLDVKLFHQIVPNGMIYVWSGWIANLFVPKTNLTGTESYFGSGMITVTSTLGNRTINGTTRVITNDHGNALYIGSHEPVKIFTDVEIGSKVPVSVAFWISGDQQFTVTGESERIYMNTMFRCWVLQSPEGSIAYYDQFTGLLLNGTFYSKLFSSDYNYSIQITGTTLDLAPNTHTPSFSLSSATPMSGNQNTAFTFRVTLTDLDNMAPVAINVTVNGMVYPLTKLNPSDTNYLDGCIYQVTVYLQPGNYIYEFRAFDGNQTRSTGTIAGPTVTQTNTHAPVFSAAGVSPHDGYNGTTSFTFSVIYTDADNNAPKSVNVTVNSVAHAMTKKDSLDTNYIDGCVYEYKLKLTPPSTYSYRFDAFDGVYACSAGPYNNLIVRLYYPIAFNGMFYNFTVRTRLPQATFNRTDRFKDASGGHFFVNSTWKNRTIDGSTRIVVSNNGSDYYNTTHEPDRLFTNMQLGDVIPISVTGYGDQQFTITGTAIIHAMKRPFECWVLQSPEGSIAYYEKYSGLLINGTFQNKVMGIPSNYSIQVIATNVPLSPNAHDPDLINVKVVPVTGDQRATFRISVVYRDLDNNQSTYVNIIFNGITYAMVKNASTSYSTGVMFNQTFTYLQPGNYIYSFACSDGQFTNTTRTYTLIVSETNLISPFLSGMFVMPPATPFKPAPYTFGVTYTDFDNNAPRFVNVTINGTSHLLTRQNVNDNNFMDGCLYQGTIPLGPGTYSYSFSCADSSFSNSTGSYWLIVNVFAPVLNSSSVSPPSGTAGTANFTFSITYWDADNNAPVYVNITINGIDHPMHKQDPTDTNYLDGCVYAVIIQLDPGTYTYTFHAGDSVFTSFTDQATLDVATSFPMMTVVIIIGVLAAGIAIVAIGVAASKKKAKKAKIAPKQKAPGKRREKAAKKLPDEPISTNVPPPPSFKPAPAAAPAMATQAAAPALGRFQCGSCGNEFKFPVSDLSQRVNCPDCGTALFRIIVCSHCGKPISITQENFPQYVGKSIQCPDCKNVFKV